MGISTKVAKAIVRKPDVDRPGSRGCRVAVNDACPEYAVVYEPGEPPIIVTVVFRTPQAYIRNGESFTPIPG